MKICRSHLAAIIFGCLFGSLLCPSVQAELTLSQTSVGRFGAGHRILPATANQDLLAWNVINSGKDMEARLYDVEGKPLSLGRCGLVVEAGVSVKNEIREVGWTQLISRYRSGGDVLEVRESLLTPALWFHTAASRLAFFQAEAATAKEPGPVAETIFLPLKSGIHCAAETAAVPYSQVRDGRLTKPYFLALVRRGSYRFPVLCLLYRNPTTISRMPSGGLRATWKQGAGAIGLLPLWGCRPVSSGKTEGWERGLPPAIARRADELAARFLSIPTGLTETYRLTRENVIITNVVTFADRRDEWGVAGKSGGYAPAPPALENARRYGYPVRYAQKVADLDYPTYLGPLAAVAGGGAIAYSLPRPRLYETLTSPFADSALEKILPEPVTRTIRDYSAYVVKAYRGKTVALYDKSAVGEGRILGSEYPCLRLMNAEARKAFTAWADSSAKLRLYNWNECYGWGEETTNGRQFYLDNYRFGSDYMDAGWFGYNVIAMWARSHYGNRWDEARQNWPRIRDLFYGWNWVYSDYGAMYSPLYVDGVNGGAAKGYTDNMGMLPALYAWARMADRLGDREMFADALYLLSRDRVARYNRMAIHDYTRRCGFRTDVPWLTSDMGNGPNIAPSGRFIPPDSSQWRNGAINDYGIYAPGVWLLSGSFLEPVTSETIDLMREGGMANRAQETVALFESRFPRWWASPAAGEMANYQIYLRGALFHEDPVRLRYYADYQDGLQQGVWSAEPWHSNAFAGIFLSRFRPLEKGEILEIREGAGWRTAKGEVEASRFLGKDERSYLSLYNATPVPLSVRVQLRDGAVMRRTLAPGANLYPLNRPIEAKPSATVVAVTGETVAVPILLTNEGKAAKRYRVTAQGFAFGKQATQEVIVSPGGEAVLTGLYSAPKIAGDAPDLRYILEADGKRTEKTIGVLFLPAVVALLDMPGEKLARTMQVGTAEVMAWNRRTHPAELRLTWRLNDKIVGDQALSVPPNQGATWKIPLKADTFAAGRYGLSAILSGAEIITATQARDIVLLPNAASPAEGIVLYGFERSAEEWFLPDWPDANKDATGKVSPILRSEEQASEGKASLKTTLNIAAGRLSRAFISVRPNFDWTSFRRARLDIYLPPDAPPGLTAGFYMMGDGWRWREAERRTPLLPGKWTTVEISLTGPAAAADWKQTEQDIRACLKNVLDIGVNLRNPAPAFPAYHGPVYLDNFRVE